MMVISAHSLQSVTIATLIASLSVFSSTIAHATQSVEITVTSNQDIVQPDQSITLREAILLVNGGLSINQLSTTEKTQIQSIPGKTRIQFQLPVGQTTIRLAQALPPIVTPNLMIDGTTQVNYVSEGKGNPIVTIAPADNQKIFRGLTIAASNVTIRGLSLYGFNQDHAATQGLPPADIFISDRASVDTSSSDITPPQNVVIERNWLGLSPQGTVTPRSAFGVSVFNATDVMIQSNRIAHNDGSAIITSKNAQNLQVRNNLIDHNGFTGMPDAIRLDGNISNVQIIGNEITENAGSGVFLFKSQGAVTIRENILKKNGIRYERAAIYLMGTDHDISQNQISQQSGPGVVVAAYPISVRSRIVNNQFASIKGLSIDLNTQHHTEAKDYQQGDGPNPTAETAARRKKTGNLAIDRPQFLSDEFLIHTYGNPLIVDGFAPPNSEVELYRVTEAGEQGPLNQPLTAVKADAKGQFSASLTGLQDGDRLSAIATLPNMGTSEPAFNSLVRSVPAPPKPPTPPEPPAPPEVPQEIRLKIPRNVHFALDKSFISPESTIILDKIVAVLKQHPSIVVEIVGHTDSRASVDYNVRLGERRALAAKTYLIRQGIESDRITTKTLGESQLKVDETSKPNFARNRRVEMIYRDIRGIKLIIEDQESDLQIER